MTSPCRPRDALEAASRVFLAEPDRYTIDEVAQPQAPLAAFPGPGDRIRAFCRSRRAHAAAARHPRPGVRRG